ncbi:MAG TPA: sarcosine oxidase subunit gamma family protein [Steroidobacteraceae bacterium]|nr:sarcosine oxidase subunit gamma family protein [Steroidobacteraceae bacterium]
MSAADPHDTLQLQSALGALHWVTAPGRGVLASERPGLSAVRMVARKEGAAALSERIRSDFQLDLPAGPARAEGRLAGDAARPFAIIGIGVGTWLAVGPRESGDLLDALRASVGSLAALTDQGGGMTVLRLTGPQVRAMLAKLLPIDLHPRAFPVGAAASTLAAYIAVTVWRLPDGPDGSAVFEIAVSRSYAVSFWEALWSSAAEFGFVPG